MLSYGHSSPSLLVFCPFSAVNKHNADAVMKPWFLLLDKTMLTGQLFLEVSVTGTCS